MNPLLFFDSVVETNQTKYFDSNESKSDSVAAAVVVDSIALDDEKCPKFVEASKKFLDEHILVTRLQQDPIVLTKSASVAKRQSR